MNCYRHPETASIATCVACGQPICQECREDVADHPMCHPCVAATQARLAQPEAPAVAGRPPGLGRRLVRGMFWGAFYAQWWTLLRIFWGLVWSGGSISGGSWILITVMFAIVHGFFGGLAGLIIGAANATESTGSAIGSGTGVVLALLEALATHSSSSLINLVFYFFTGRFVGRSMTARVQAPLAPAKPAPGTPVPGIPTVAESSVTSARD